MTEHIHNWIEGCKANSPHPSDDCPVLQSCTTCGAYKMKENK